MGFFVSQNTDSCDSFTVLQLITYSLISKQSKASMKKTQHICFLTSIVRQIKMLSKITSVQSDSMLVSQAEDVQSHNQKP